MARSGTEARARDAALESALSPTPMSPSAENPTLRVTPARDETFWRVEDSLLDLGAVRPLAFFARNAHRYSERWKRVTALYGVAGLRVLLYATSPVLSSRVLHVMTRGMSRDRLDALGEEYFEVVLAPRLKKSDVDALHRVLQSEGGVVLVSQGLEHVVRPLARTLGVERFVANRLEMRDGICTGRMIAPVVHSRGGIAGLASRDPHGRPTLDELGAALGLDRETLRRAITSVKPQPPVARPVVHFPGAPAVDRLSVRQALGGKQILLIGVTGFIGKVWLAHLLTELPEVGRVHLLIRKQRSVSPRRRFEKIVEESPLFAGLHERYGDHLSRFIGARIEVVEGDVSKPDLGLAPEKLASLRRELDVVVNSSGLTDFDPDLRQALDANVEAPLHVLDFVRGSDHAALLHLSTCFVVGDRDGRVREELVPDYVPRPQPGFDAGRERQELHARIQDARAWPPAARLVEELADVPAAGNGNRFGWLRKVLTEMGSHRARELGWPNSYAFTKSLFESLMTRAAGEVPIAIVRPAIVETSLQQPFPGWNEGLNTSAPLSWLLGTTFRQLPANERKCLDIIPVDLVCKGLTLVAAALVRRCHRPVYQLATSVTNPCDMKRAIELTSLAHRKHYREQKGARYWWKARMDAIPVSKTRYQNLSAPRYRAILSGLRRLLSPLPFLRLHALVRAERAVSRVAKLVEIYEPFILHNEHVFEAENVRVLSAALPADERETFAYEPECFDWREYWIDIHVPALRRWCYPLIETGRPPEVQARQSFRLPEAEPAAPVGPAQAVGTET